jgi:hypothetical protein
MRYELTDREWTTIKPFLPNKPLFCARCESAAALLVQMTT